MRLILLGPPGVGKGTQSQRLAAHLGVPHLSTGEMLRQAIAARTELGLFADAYMSAGHLVPDDTVMQLIRVRLDQPDCQQGYLLDGFPRTLGQAKSLDQFLDQRNLQLIAVLELQVNEEEIIDRLARRGRHDDRPEIIHARLQSYAAQTAPLVSYYRAQSLLHPIEATGTQDEVFARIKQILAEIH